MGHKTPQTFLVLLLLTMLSVSLTFSAMEKNIRISTDKTDLVLQVGDNGRLYQVYLGDRLTTDADFRHFNWKKCRPLPVMVRASLATTL